MRAGTSINIIDQSTIKQPVSAIAAADTTTPLFGMLITSDKGPEDPGEYMGQDFFDAFCSDSSLSTAYKKHGQPLLQAINIINAGGKLFVKRLVALDSTLANVIVVAKVYQSSVQKVDSEGKPLYIQTDGSEGITVTETLALNIFATIKYELVSAQNAKTMADVKKLIETSNLYDSTGTEVDSKTVFSYPLFVITDNGRGLSNKKIKFSTDFVSSKNLSFAMNNFSILENGTGVETTRFTMNPNIIYQSTSYELEVMSRNYIKQVRVDADSDIMNEYIAKVAELGNLDVEELLTLDILTGSNRKGTAIENITFDEDSVDITSEYGIDLSNGTNGTFGANPFGTEAYKTEGVKYLTGKMGSEIYDRATHKVSLWLDANYPDEFKRQLEVLTAWRKDGVYLADMGTEIYTMEDIREKAALINRSFYNSHYCTAYEVYDPYSRKAIAVTMLYSLAPLLVEHVKTTPQNPMMGTANNMVITDIIDGSVRFKPSETPDEDEKVLLEELRVNYATYVEGDFTPETGYTSQTAFTQLSFSNNVVALQEVGRGLRKACPPERYKLLDIKAGDLKSYEDKCNLALEKYKTWFATLEFAYTADPVMKSNKIFNASVYFMFNDFFQTEQFDFYALGE